jgi:hypothetical protein
MRHGLATIGEGQSGDGITATHNRRASAGGNSPCHLDGALAKRRHELMLLSDSATSHRPILSEYSPYLLDQMIAVVTASTLISYVFYTISPDTQQKFGSPWLGLTTPFPLYGIFRYLYLVHQRNEGGSPADLLLTDRPLLACVAFWVLFVTLIIYRPFI